MSGLWVMSPDFYARVQTSMEPGYQTILTIQCSWNGLNMVNYLSGPKNQSCMLSEKTFHKLLIILCLDWYWNSTCMYST